METGDQQQNKSLEWDFNPAPLPKVMFDEEFVIGSESVTEDSESTVKSTKKNLQTMARGIAKYYVVHPSDSFSIKNFEAITGKDFNHEINEGGVRGPKMTFAWNGQRKRVPDASIANQYGIHQRNIWYPPLECDELVNSHGVFALGRQVVERQLLLHLSKEVEEPLVVDMYPRESSFPMLKGIFNNLGRYDPKTRKVQRRSASFHGHRTVLTTDDVFRGRKLYTYPKNAPAPNCALFFDTYDLAPHDCFAVLPKLSQVLHQMETREMPVFSAFVSFLDYRSVDSIYPVYKAQQFGYTQIFGGRVSWKVDPQEETIHTEKGDLEDFDLSSNRIEVKIKKPTPQLFNKYFKGAPANPTYELPSCGGMKYYDVVTARMTDQDEEYRNLYKAEDFLEFPEGCFDVQPDPFGKTYRVEYRSILVHKCPVTGMVGVRVMYRLLSTHYVPVALESKVMMVHDGEDRVDSLQDAYGVSAKVAPVARTGNIQLDICNPFVRRAKEVVTDVRSTYRDIRLKEHNVTRALQKTTARVFNTKVGTPPDQIDKENHLVPLITTLSLVTQMSAKVDLSPIQNIVSLSEESAALAWKSQYKLPDFILDPFSKMRTKRTLTEWTLSAVEITYQLGRALLVKLGSGVTTLISSNLAHFIDVSPLDALGSLASIFGNLGFKVPNKVVAALSKLKQLSFKTVGPQIVLIMEVVLQALWYLCVAWGEENLKRHYAFAISAINFIEALAYFLQRPGIPVGRALRDTLIKGVMHGVLTLLPLPLAVGVHFFIDFFSKDAFRLRKLWRAEVKAYEKEAWVEMEEVRSDEWGSPGGVASIQKHMGVSFELDGAPIPMDVVEGLVMKNCDAGKPQHIIKFSPGFRYLPREGFHALTAHFSRLVRGDDFFMKSYEHRVNMWSISGNRLSQFLDDMGVVEPLTLEQFETYIKGQPFSKAKKRDYLNKGELRFATLELTFEDALESLRVKNNVNFMQKFDEKMRDKEIDSINSKVPHVPRDVVAKIFRYVEGEEETYYRGRVIALIHKVTQVTMMRYSVPFTKALLEYCKDNVLGRMVRSVKGYSSFVTIAYGWKVADANEYFNTLYHAETGFYTVLFSDDIVYALIFKKGNVRHVKLLGEDVSSFDVSCDRPVLETAYDIYQNHFLESDDFIGAMESTDSVSKMFTTIPVKDGKLVAKIRTTPWSTKTGVATTGPRACLIHLAVALAVEDFLFHNWWEPLHSLDNHEETLSKIRNRIASLYESHGFRLKGGDGWTDFDQFAFLSQRLYPSGYVVQEDDQTGKIRLSFPDSVYWQFAPISPVKLAAMRLVPEDIVPDQHRAKAKEIILYGLVRGCANFRVNPIAHKLLSVYSKETKDLSEEEKRVGREVVKQWFHPNRIIDVSGTEIETIDVDTYVYNWMRYCNMPMRTGTFLKQKASVLLCLDVIGSRSGWLFQDDSVVDAHWSDMVRVHYG